MRAGCALNYNNENALSRLWCEIENPVLVLCDEVCRHYIWKPHVRALLEEARAKNRKRGVLKHGRYEGTQPRRSRLTSCAMSWKLSTARPRTGSAAPYLLPRNAKRGLKYLLHNGPIISAKYIYTYAKYHKNRKQKLCLLGLPAGKKDYPAALKQWFLRITTPTRRLIWSIPRPSAKRPNG